MNTVSRPDAEQYIAAGLMDVLRGFHGLQFQPTESSDARAQAERLQAFITESYYSCTHEVLRGLWRMYGGGGSFTENINKNCGSGTAEYAARGIESYCNEDQSHANSKCTIHNE